MQFLGSRINGYPYTFYALNFAPFTLSLPWVKHTTWMLLYVLYSLAFTCKPWALECKTSLPALWGHHCINLFSLNYERPTIYMQCWEPNSGLLEMLGKCFPTNTPPLKVESFSCCWVKGRVRKSPLETCGAAFPFQMEMPTRAFGSIWEVLEDSCMHVHVEIGLVILLPSPLHVRQTPDKEPDSVPGIPWAQNSTDIKKRNPLLWEKYWSRTN